MMKTYALDPSRQNLERSKQFICTGIEQGVLRPVIDRTFALADIAEAYRYMEANTQFGKIVVTTGDVPVCRRLSSKPEPMGNNTETKSPRLRARKSGE